MQISFPDIVKISLETFQTYGDTIFSYFAIYPMIGTRDPGVASEILNSTSCKEKNFIYFAIEKYFCNGVLTCNYEEWQRQRKILTLAVQPKALLNYIPIINRNANELCYQISKLAGKGESELHLIVKKCIFKNSAETFMAKDIENVEDIPIEIFER